jgi:hypothetical protein
MGSGPQRPEGGGAVTRCPTWSSSRRCHCRAAEGVSATNKVTSISRGPVGVCGREPRALQRTAAHARSKTSASHGVEHSARRVAATQPLSRWPIGIERVARGAAHRPPRFLDGQLLPRLVDHGIPPRRHATPGYERVRRSARSGARGGRRSASHQGLVSVPAARDDHGPDRRPSGHPSAARPVRAPGPARPSVAERATHAGADRPQNWSDPCLMCSVTGHQLFFLVRTVVHHANWNAISAITTVL